MESQDCQSLTGPRAGLDAKYDAGHDHDAGYDAGHDPAGYTLGRAMRIVRTLETTETRRAVFADIVAKNRTIRLADTLYRSAGRTALRRLILAAYMLKCAASLQCRPGSEAKALAVASFANETRTIARIARIVPDLNIVELGPRGRNAMAAGQIRALLRFLGALPRCWRVLGKIARAHSFMPACRIASVLAYYIRLGDLFDNNPALRAGVLASNYSPEAVGLAAAAHRRGRAVLYANHAPVPLNSPSVPPVLADLSFFYGDMLQETYRRRSRCEGQVVLIGQSEPASPLVWQETPRRVGIFLTALTRQDTVTNLVAAIKDIHPNMGILIRNHPVALIAENFATLRRRFPDLQVTNGTPLTRDLDACDVIFCGNSGVTLNALRHGRPVAYAPALDKLPFDYNGFLDLGLVPRVDTWTEATYGALRAFYATPAWGSVMARYDASYATPVDTLEHNARAAVLSCLAPRASTTPAACPG